MLVSAPISVLALLLGSGNERGSNRNRAANAKYA
jgi:hypothetical protein